MNNNYNKNNSQKQNKEPSNETRSFTNTSKLEVGKDGMKFNTEANIKKAKVKRSVKKVLLVSLMVLKKAFQWTFNVALTLMLVCTICAIIVGGWGYMYVKNDLMIDDFDIQPSDLRNDLSQTSWIYYDSKYDQMYVDENGNPIYAPIELYGTENRMWVSYDQMPEDLVNAFIAIEDERYWQHNGVDWRRTFGAVRGYVTGSDTYGGSTITQQLIKNVTGDDETTAERKITEIFRALSLSEKRTKEEVLEMYLNKIHLSRSNYGVWAAANYYFGKDIAAGDELTLVECAALASIPKSPTKYDPVRNPEYNKERRQLVLDKMYELEWITKDEYEEAKDADLELKITYEQTQQQGKYSYFTDALIEQLVEDLGTEYGYDRVEAMDIIYTGGLTIYSTENPVIQGKMETIFNDPETFKKVDEGIQPQSAMVVMDPYTGEVVGLVGGRGEKDGKLDFNRATQSTRQVGSSIKPLTVYAPAMDLGIINYGTMMDDTPVYMENMNRYWPSNSPNRYEGHISINEAVVKSKNTTAVKLVKDAMGVDYVYDFAKNTLHLESLVDDDKNIAPLALGGFTNGLTVMEMTAAYSIFPNNGYYSPPRLYTKVLRPDGTVLLDKTKNHEEYVIAESTSKVMTKILENVVWNGTAAKITLKYELDCAGKTGSTNDNKDIYYCGFTPYYVGACWFGYDIAKDLTAFGTNPAMLAWEKVMRSIHEPEMTMALDAENPVPLKTFDDSKLKSALVCKDSGLLPSEKCALDLRGSREITAWYYDGIGMPTRTCTAHDRVFKWCTESNMRAGEFCPEVVNASLVRETSRDFGEHNVTVLDSEYMYDPVTAIETCTLHAPYVPPEDVPGEDGEGGEALPEDITEVNDGGYDPTLDMP